jgi:hypothetical protein
MQLKLNGKDINRVIIDQHYKKKHGDLTDEIILKLLKSIDGEDVAIVKTEEDFEYYKIEPVFYNQAPYRLIIVLNIFENFLGVVNAFRVEKKKYERQ